MSKRRTLPSPLIHLQRGRHPHQVSCASCLQSISTTNADGRCTDLLPPRGSEEAKAQKAELAPGTYKMIFRTNEYFEKTGRKSFYPWVEVGTSRVFADPDF